MLGLQRNDLLDLPASHYADKLSTLLDLPIAEVLANDQANDTAKASQQEQVHLTMGNSEVIRFL